MRFALCLLPVLLAGCGEAVRDDHFANDAREIETPRAEPPPVVTDAVPVRIGEAGPSFEACNAAGTTRNLGTGEALQVRAAPFETAAETGAVGAGARFFVCTRSHDQRWLGIVYDPGGELSAACGVSAPVTSRRPYGGPCRSGCVASAFVKLIAG